MYREQVTAQDTGHSALQVGPGTGEKRRPGLGLRILCVEDDEQLQTVLAGLLENEGYDVVTASTATAGLAEMAKTAFHLLISDYWLPDRTAAWMLSKASQAGYLKNSRVLVVTAEHRPQGIENIPILRKPIDLDEFLRFVQDELAPLRHAELEKVKQEVLGMPKAKEPQSSSAKLHLTLYISASSPSSLKALRNLRALLSGYDASQVDLKVLDLSKEGAVEAEEDRIAFTPTLVKRSPDPKIWILGDLEKAEIVSDLLAQSGVERHP